MLTTITEISLCYFEMSYLTAYVHEHYRGTERPVLSNSIAYTCIKYMTYLHEVQRNTVGFMYQIGSSILTHFYRLREHHDFISNTNQSDGPKII